MVARIIINSKKKRFQILPFDISLILLLLIVLATQLNLASLLVFEHTEWIYTVIILLFIREASALKLRIKGFFLNPAQLFIISFLTIIAIGTLMLLLPSATYTQIQFIDALFTSTSAVCVTGLIVVDTGSYFTFFGQIVIIMLIQAGGLGIMTFASYFSYFFKGTSSYRSQLQLKEMTYSEGLADVFSTLKRIIVLTLVIEILGGIFIYLSLEEAIIHSVDDRIFFSVFHSISGFCNAGFSTLANSFYEPAFRFNYPLHMIIATLFILGGIGFPILFNLYKYLKYIVRERFIKYSLRKKSTHLPWVINLNTKIVFLTTFILIITGTLAFYVLEYNHTLAEHNGIGKIVTAFFGATTPRTAGFNTVDTGSLRFPTMMFIILLMWIGASPASTGGGIKTSTFAIGFLNFISVARGKKRIEIFRRELSKLTINRAFGIMMLSLIVIWFSVFLMTFFEEDKQFIPLLFEAFSAFSTVGLSRGITADLSNASKIIIIFTMFIGRVSMLTILIAILKKFKPAHYSYPKQEILIN
ncbi:MAG: ATPase [Bacteroidales bacterium]|nr:ATPase [Bacteroidales bacterium]